MKKTKHKIVLFSDMKNSIRTALKSAIGLAKIIGGEIEVFHVKKPVEVVEKENQLSALRSMSSEFTITDKKMRDAIAPLAKDYAMNIRHSFVFGNVKNEVSNYINEARPDIIVLQKKKLNPFNLRSNGVTNFVLNNFTGTVLIATEKNGIEPDKEIALGILNGFELSQNLDFAEDLMVHTKKPLKSFTFVKNSDTRQVTSTRSGAKTVEYVFEHNDSTVKNLSNYLSKNNINLLYVDNGENNKTNSSTSDINAFINKLNTSILVSGRKA